jgi:hypothetical protein
MRRPAKAPLNLHGGGRLPHLPRSHKEVKNSRFTLKSCNQIGYQRAFELHRLILPSGLPEEQVR